MEQSQKRCSMTTKGANQPLTEEERTRATVLNASGKTPSAIARGMGRSHHTLQRFLAKPEVREQEGMQVKFSPGCSIMSHTGSSTPFLQPTSEKRD